MARDVRNNQEKHCFEVALDGGKLALIDYHLRDGVIAYTHTEVPPEFEGQGIAADMAKAALNYARDAGLKVLPLCPYVASYVKRHHDWDDILVGV